MALVLLGILRMKSGNSYCRQRGVNTESLCFGKCHALKRKFQKSSIFPTTTKPSPNRNESSGEPQPPVVMSGGTVDGGGSAVIGVSPETGLFCQPIRGSGRDPRSQGRGNPPHTHTLSSQKKVQRSKSAEGGIQTPGAFSGGRLGIPAAHTEGGSNHTKKACPGHADGLVQDQFAIQLDSHRRDVSRALKKNILSGWPKLDGGQLKGKNCSVEKMCVRGKEGFL